MDGVAPDGSPVEVCRSLPVQPDLDRLLAALPAGCSVLDLGTGVGRLANPLAAAGYDVVAVDESAEMLAHVIGAERVRADIWSLDLGRRFHGVLALSHLVNSRSRSRRIQLLDVCRRHLQDDGVLIVQRYSPEWSPAERSSTIGRVAIRLHDVVLHVEGFSAAVTYTVGVQSWTQRFDAMIVDDDELAALAAATGFTVRGNLDVEGVWVVLAPFIA